MMGIGPEECGRMDFWTYQALLHNWNEAHRPEGEATLTGSQRSRLDRFNSAHGLH